ncbi:hypothetical protein [Brevibacterium casei]|uniref:hypothetical protein n=1 Tax=Brevibacterium casei TaxID=33889 RepID=UPI00370126D2
MSSSGSATAARVSGAPSRSRRRPSSVRMVLFLIAALTMAAGLLALPHAGEMSDAMSGQMSGAMTGSVTSTAHGMSGSSHGASGSAAPGAASTMGGHQPADVGQISANDEITAVTCADMPCAGDHDPLTPCIVMLMCALAAIVLSLLLPRSRGTVFRLPRGDTAGSRPVIARIPAPPDSHAPSLTVLSISRT